MSERVQGSGSVLCKTKEKVYFSYKHKIFPKISNRRGANRLRMFLKDTLVNCVKKVEEEPEPIFEKEWDNLIILDACRHDIYQEVFSECDYRITVGSATPEYIEKTFGNLSGSKSFSDVIYITGNPFFYPRLFKSLTGEDIDDVFFEVYNTFETDWDEGNGVVMPEAILRDANTAEKLFPDKRKIIHFMQPHTPFLKSDIDTSLNTVPEGISGIDPKDISKEKHVDDENLSELELAQRGEVSYEQALHDYKENLEILKEYLSELNSCLDGKTVVTADHGEALNQKGLYSHWKGSDIEVLRKVPWDILEE